MASSSTTPRVVNGLVLKAAAIAAHRAGVALGKRAQARSANAGTNVTRWPKHAAFDKPQSPPVVDARPSRQKTHTSTWLFVSIRRPNPTLEPPSTPLTWLNAQLEQHAMPVIPHDAVRVVFVANAPDTRHNCTKYAIAFRTSCPETKQLCDTLIAASAEGRLPGVVTIEEYARGVSRYASQGDADLQRAEDATVNLFDSMDFATVITAPATEATVGVAGQLHETAALLATEALTGADDATEALTGADDASVQHQELSREDTERASLSSAVSPDEDECSHRQEQLPESQWRTPSTYELVPYKLCDGHPLRARGFTHLYAQQGLTCGLAAIANTIPSREPVTMDQCLQVLSAHMRDDERLSLVKQHGLSVEEVRTYVAEVLGPDTVCFRFRVKGAAVPDTLKKLLALSVSVAEDCAGHMEPHKAYAHLVKDCDAILLHVASGAESGHWTAAIRITPADGVVESDTWYYADSVRGPQGLCFTSYSAAGLHDKIRRLVGRTAGALLSFVAWPRIRSSAVTSDDESAARRSDSPVVSEAEGTPATPTQPPTPPTAAQRYNSEAPEATRQSTVRSPSSDKEPSPMQQRSAFLPWRQGVQRGRRNRRAGGSKHRQRGKKTRRSHRRARRHRPSGRRSTSRVGIETAVERAQQTQVSDSSPASLRLRRSNADPPVFIDVAGQPVAPRALQRVPTTHDVLGVLRESTRGTPDLLELCEGTRVKRKFWQTLAWHLAHAVGMPYAVMATFRANPAFSLRGRLRSATTVQAPPSVRGLVTAEAELQKAAQLNWVWVFRGTRRGNQIDWLNQTSQLQVLHRVNVRRSDCQLPGDSNGWHGYWEVHVDGQQPTYRSSGQLVREWSARNPATLSSDGIMLIGWKEPPVLHEARSRASRLGSRLSSADERVTQRCVTEDAPRRDDQVRAPSVEATAQENPPGAQPSPSPLPATPASPCGSMASSTLQQDWSSANSRRPSPTGPTPTPQSPRSPATQFALRTSPAVSGAAAASEADPLSPPHHSVTHNTPTATSASARSSASQPCEHGASDCTAMDNPVAQEPVRLLDTRKPETASEALPSPSSRGIAATEEDTATAAAAVEGVAGAARHSAVDFLALTPSPNAHEADETGEGATTATAVAEGTEEFASDGGSAMEAGGEVPARCLSPEATRDHPEVTQAWRQRASTACAAWTTSVKAATARTMRLKKLRDRALLQGNHDSRRRDAYWMLLTVTRQAATTPADGGVAADRQLIFAELWRRNARATVWEVADLVNRVNEQGGLATTLGSRLAKADDDDDVQLDVWCDSRKDVPRF